MDNTSRIRKNIIFNVLGQSLLLIISLLAVRYIYKEVGGDALGIIYFAMLLNTIITSILGLGLKPIIVRDVASHVEKNAGYVRDFIQTVSFSFWLAFLVVAVGVYLFVPIIVDNWIILADMTKEQASHVLRVLMVFSALAIPQAIYIGVLDGFQRMEYPNAIDVLIGLIQQGGTIIVLLTGGGVLGVAYWIAGCFIGKVILLISVSARFVSLAALLPKLHLPILRQNMSSAGRLAGISLLGLVHTQADKIMLSKLLPLAMLSYYNVAHSILSKTKLLALPVARAAYPLFCELIERKEINKSLRRYDELQDLVCYASIPLIAGIIYFNEIIFSFIFDANVAGEMTSVILVLSVAMYMQISFSVPHYYVLASRQERIVLRQSVYNACISLPTAFIATYYLGLVGAGLGFLVSRLFVMFYLVPKISRDCLRRNSTIWFAHLAKAVSVGVLTYGLAWIVKSYSGSSTILEVLASYLLGTILFILMGWYSIGRSLRMKLLRSVRRT